MVYGMSGNLRGDYPFRDNAGKGLEVSLEDSKHLTFVEPESVVWVVAEIEMRGYLM